MKSLNKIFNFYLFIFAIIIIYVPINLSAQENSGAVIIAYHRFGENDYPSTNIRIEQFTAHIQELKKEKYNILPLDKIIESLKKGEVLPDRTIAVTIDDAFESVYNIAWPRLKESNIPFTLFVSTTAINESNKGMMSWEQIIELKKSGVLIGNHSSSHKHLAFMEPDIWKNDIIVAQKILKEKLGTAPLLFAHPFGETNRDIISFLKKEGFIAAFGQHSGVASDWLDPYYLPRFSFNEQFGDIARFILAVNSLSIPVKEITPKNLILKNNPPLFGFTIAQENFKTNGLQCFFSGYNKPAKIYRLSDKRIEARVDYKSNNKRIRINCTMPSDEKRWHWFGMQYLNN